jgi:apolipoprotein N-acyltransferase
VRSGAQVLVNLNNLAMFAGTLAPAQHQLLARFRSIENRRWLLRCGSNGKTAAISATGRVVVQAPQDEPAAIWRPRPCWTG